MLGISLKQADESEVILYSGSFVVDTSSCDPTLRLVLNAPRLSLSHRLDRRFGSHRFFEIEYAPDTRIEHLDSRSLTDVITRQSFRALDGQIASQLGGVYLETISPQAVGPIKRESKILEILSSLKGLFLCDSWNRDYGDELWTNDSSRDA